MRCTRCNTGMPPQARYCPRCGERCPRPVKGWGRLVVLSLLGGFVAVGVLTLSIGSGTPRSSSSRPSPTSAIYDRLRTEVERLPDALLDANVRSSDLTLYGAAVGDPLSQVRAKDMRSMSPSSAISKRGDVFAAPDGWIESIQIKDRQILSALDIGSDRELFHYFGPPAVQSPPNPRELGPRTYHYNGRGIDVTWDPGRQELVSITLRRPTARER